ncbi:MAG: ATP-binding protein, partial [Nanopusillaceae archaeon]
MHIRKYTITKKEDIKRLNVKERIYKEFSKNLINVIVGPRRAGKTYYLYDLILNKLKLKDEDYVYINFEDYVEFNDPFDIITIHKELYGKEPEYLFFDEIQSLKNWERFIYTLYESKRYYIFITGSNSKLLSTEIATQLRGRTKTINIFPLSFIEIFKYENITKDKISIYDEGKIKNIVNKNIYTQLPDIYFNNEDPFEIFNQYFDLVIQRDVINR